MPNSQKDNSASPRPRRRSRRQVLHPDTPPWLFRAILFGVAAWWASRAVVSLVGTLRDILITLAASFIFACAIENPVQRLCARGLRRGVATIIMLLAGVMGFLGLAAIVGAMVASQITHLATHYTTTVDSVVASLNHLFGTHLRASTLLAKFHSLHLKGVGSSSGLTTKSLAALGQVGNVLMGLLVTFYLTAEGPQLRRMACSVMPPASQAELLRAWEIAIEKTSGYFTSRFLLAALRTLVLALVLVVLHVPAWLALAVWFGVIAEFVPVIGTALGIALPVAIALTVSPLTALITLLFLTLFTQVRNFILAPKLSRRAVNVHPAVAFLAIVVAAKIVGPAGTLVTIPVVATLQAFASSYVARHDIAAQSELLAHPVRKKAKKEKVSETTPVPVDPDAVFAELLAETGTTIEALRQEARQGAFSNEAHRLAWLAVSPFVSLDDAGDAT